MDKSKWTATTSIRGVLSICGGRLTPTVEDWRALSGDSAHGPGNFVAGTEVCIVFQIRIMKLFFRANKLLTFYSIPNQGINNKAAAPQELSI